MQPNYVFGKKQYTMQKMDFFLNVVDSYHLIQLEYNSR